MKRILFALGAVSAVALAALAFAVLQPTVDVAASSNVVQASAVSAEAAVDGIRVASVGAGLPSGGFGGVYTSLAAERGAGRFEAPSWSSEFRRLARSISWGDWGDYDGNDDADRPVVNSSGWDWLGDYFDYTVSGFSPSKRVWVYRVVPEAGVVVSSCDPSEHSVLTITSVMLGSGKSGHQFIDLKISSVLFEEGPNYVCAMDADGNRMASPTVLTVYPPPDVYRIGLSITEVSKGTLAGFPSSSPWFSVMDGRHYASSDSSDQPWRLPQYRGTGRAAGQYLTKTWGSLSRCYDGDTAKVGVRSGSSGRQVGCRWAPHDSSKPGVIGLESVVGKKEPVQPVQVPGDDLEFRVGFHPNQFSGREKERFAVFWGPVDLWLLGAPGDLINNAPVGPSNYAIHQSHLERFQRKVITQADLDAEGYFSLMISRESANARGDTFVAVVPCNQDYLGPANPGTDLDRNKRALPDCDKQLTSNVDFDDLSSPTPLRLAWQQHDVTSGLGMSCDVSVEVTRTAVRWDGDGQPLSYSYARTYDIECENNLRSVTRTEVKGCDDKLREAATFDPEQLTYDEDKAVEPYSGLECGWGPHVPLQENPSYWGETEYNAARSVYGFVIDWQKGPPPPTVRPPGCNVELLRYRLTRDGEIVSVIEGTHPVGTRYWRLGTAPENDVDCSAPSGVNSVDVNFFTAKADPAWSVDDSLWHGNQAAHFAVYASGLTRDHEVDAASGGSGWKRIALGAWDWSDERINLDGGLRQPLGMAFPLGDSAVTVPGDGDAGINLAEVRDFYDKGKAFTVPRDMANINGEVRLYVVPCLPNYAYAGFGVRHCRDLARGAGSGHALEFRQADSDAGPFGLTTKQNAPQVLRYSYVVTVNFEGMLDSDRAVSLPYQDDTPTGRFCEVKRAADGIWLESTYSGGACDIDVLEPVMVRFSNVNVSGTPAHLAIYATGGRTPTMDLVEVKHASGGAGATPGSAQRLGRLGVMERVPVMIARGRVNVVTVTPDMADANGDVWLLAYHCDGEAVALCPRSGRGKFGEITGFRMAPALSFAVRVRYTEKSGIRHTSLGPICQGRDCAPPVPDVLLEAEPDLPGNVCGITSYDRGRLWPDRLVRGGACAPGNFGTLSVSLNHVAAKPQDVVVYATGGRGSKTNFDLVQVRRGWSESVSSPAGRSGLTGRVYSLSSTSPGTVNLDYSMSDEYGADTAVGLPM